MNRQDLITRHHDLVRRHEQLHDASKRMLVAVMAMMVQGCRDDDLWVAYQVLKNAVHDQEVWKVNPDDRVDSQP